MRVAEVSVAHPVVDGVGVLLQIAADGLGQILCLQRVDDRRCHALDGVRLLCRGGVVRRQQRLQRCGQLGEQRQAAQGTAYL